MSVLVAEKREGIGKSLNRKLRRSGFIPAVIYGQTDNVDSVTINAHDLGQLLKAGHTIVELEVGGKKQETVIKEIQYHPVTGKYLHVDFMRIAKGQELKVEVPLRYEGKPVGVDEGGVLSTIKSEILINVIPKYIPDYITVDVSGLNIGDSLRVKDLTVENMQIIDDEEEVLCYVSAIRTPLEEEEEEEALAEEEEEAEPEVITSRKKDEEESEE
jgi:large subunit ribosomal protein L25